jgi:hypothetical protein
MLCVLVGAGYTRTNSMEMSGERSSSQSTTVGFVLSDEDILDSIGVEVCVHLNDYVCAIVVVDDDRIYDDDLDIHRSGLRHAYLCDDRRLVDVSARARHQRTSRLQCVPAH